MMPFYLCNLETFVQTWLKPWIEQIVYLCAKSTVIKVARLGVSVWLTHPRSKCLGVALKTTGKSFDLVLPN
jgi:hypothetical protein